LRDPAIVTKLIGSRGTHIDKTDNLIAIDTGATTLTYTLEQYVQNLTIISTDDDKHQQIAASLPTHPNLKPILVHDIGSFVVPSENYKIFIALDLSNSSKWLRHLLNRQHQPTQVFTILSIDNPRSLESPTSPSSKLRTIIYPLYDTEIISSVFLPERASGMVVCMKYTLRPEPLLTPEQHAEFNEFVTVNWNNTETPTDMPAKNQPQHWLNTFLSQKTQIQAVSHVTQDTSVTAIKNAQTPSQLRSERRAIVGRDSVSEQGNKFVRPGRGVQPFPGLTITEHAFKRIKSRISLYADLVPLLRNVLKHRKFATTEVQQPSGELAKLIDFKGNIYVFSEDFSLLITTYPSNRTRTGQRKLYDYIERREKSKKRRSLEAYDRNKSHKEINDEF